MDEQDRLRCGSADDPIGFIVKAFFLLFVLFFRCSVSCLGGVRQKILKLLSSTLREGEVKQAGAKILTRNRKLIM